VIAVDAERFQSAKRNLATVDVVGVTESFGAFVSRLRDGYGWWPSGETYDPRANVSEEPWVASAALRARIERDNPFDRELYEQARTLP
jgi:hypothetical protein